MTVIAYRDGVVSADSQETMWDGRIQQCTKLFKVNGSIVATAGDSYTGLIYLEWFKKGAIEEHIPDLSMVTIDEDFECLVIENLETIYTVNRFFQKYEIEITDGFFALGCGAGYAMAAMEMGAGSKEAVKVAIKYDAYCGGKVQSYKVK